MSPSESSSLQESRNPGPGSVSLSQDPVAFRNQTGPESGLCRVRPHPSCAEAAARCDAGREDGGGGRGREVKNESVGLFGGGA